MPGISGSPVPPEIFSLVVGARAGNDSLPLPGGTPIVIIGDMNLVGDSRQLATLLGAPGAEGGGVAAGPGPDWDGTALADLLPYHSAAPESYTWMSSERSGFGPGRLDLVIYTDSVLQSVKSYILCTETMGKEDLAKAGLNRSDSPSLSDHRPIVADFVIK
ncbi:MAG: endonuclease/exonuclease/phosphatase family protein [PVC group bacterium]